MILDFPPPRNWQDFETLTKDVARFKLAGDFENYGRLGQAQNGVDIYGWDFEYKNTAIQCKHKASAKASDLRIVTEIKKEVIDKEVALADTFQPELKVFIIATTSFRDVDLQSHINIINDSRKNSKLPKIIIWTWDLFQEEINRHSELQYIYYTNILQTFNQYNKDNHILSLLKYTLDRPAFNTEFHVENRCEDFLKAIIDTQTAFTTVKLNTREGVPLASSYPCKNLSNSVDREYIQEAYILLQEIRNYVTEQYKLGNIIQQNDFLEFRNNWEFHISEYLNKTRARIITLINHSLRRNKLELINSVLLK